MSEADAYKAHITGVFSRASASYDHVGPAFFSKVGSRLVEFAGVAPGSRVLDVACGRGAVFVPASRAVSAAGQVIGIDLADGMVEQARGEVARLGLANTQVLKMDAEKLEFPDAHFDFVLCSLCLFFFPALDHTLAGFLRVLKPGGILAASTFETHEDAHAKRWDELDKSFEEYLRPVPTAQTADLDTPPKIMDVLSQAGLGQIEIVPEEEAFYFANEDDWWKAAWSHGYRGFLERMEPDVLARYKERAIELVRQEATGQGIAYRWHLLYSRGVKPA